MKIVIITQNEPFYLYTNLKYLFNLLPENIEIVGCVIAPVSPFGKRESFLKKILKTYAVFGPKFFLYYSFRYFYSKLFKPSIDRLLHSKKIDKIKLIGSINSKESLDKIRSYNPDLLVSILGNQIFKRQLLELAPKGSINLHSSLLPKYRGLMPTFWVLKNNENFTGVSVFFIDEGIDSGPIIIQKKIKIETKIQAVLIRETKKIGMELIAKAIELIDREKVKLISNPNNKKTYYSFPTKQDVIEFKKAGKKFF